MRALRLGRCRVSEARQGNIVEDRVVRDAKRRWMALPLLPGISRGEPCEGARWPHRERAGGRREAYGWWVSQGKSRVV